MKKKIILFGLYCFAAFAATAQTKITLDGPGKYDSTKIPLVIINNFRTDLNHVVVNPVNIDSLNVLKDAISLSKYGEDAKDGVIVIYHSKKAEMMHLDEILKVYSFTEESKKIKILLNNKVIKHPEKIYIDKSKIKNVALVNNQPSLDVDEVAFINISTE